MTSQSFIQELTQFGKQILPTNSSLWLYGSRARNQARQDSDWDILILLDKEKRDITDWNTYCWPFNDFGFEKNQYVSPKLFTRTEWQTMQAAPFAQNVEQDKIVLV